MQLAAERALSVPRNRHEASQPGSGGKAPPPHLGRGGDVAGGGVRAKPSGAQEVGQRRGGCRLTCAAAAAREGGGRESPLDLERGKHPGWGRHEAHGTGQGTNRPHLAWSSPPRLCMCAPAALASARSASHFMGCMALGASVAPRREPVGLTWRDPVHLRHVRPSGAGLCQERVPLHGLHGTGRLSSTAQGTSYSTCNLL